jgi:glycosyltransferase involved in cell wall biosynthesis
VKEVLILTYAFPPTAYVGVHRTLKYCKFLPEFGWQPSVVTADPRKVAFQDPHLVMGVSESLTVRRTFDVDPAKWLQALETRAAGKKARAVASRDAREDAHPIAPRTSLKGQIAGAVKNSARRLLLESPDSHVFWLPFALLAARRLAKTATPDVFYSTSPPHSTHFATAVLARQHRRPYVLDFRDPWPDQRSARGTFLSSWRRAVIEGAALIVCASDGESEELREEFPSVSGRVVAITNGYDPVDFDEFESPAFQPGTFNVSHVGTIYPGTAGELFEAIQLATTRHTELQADLRVHLLGGVGGEYGERIRRLEGTVQHYGFVPHRTAIGFGARSDVVLILLGGRVFSGSHLPAKTFEYMYLGSRILAVAPEGDLTRLLADYGNARVVPPGSPERLADAIWTEYRDRGKGHDRRSDVTAYSRRHLTGVLAGHLDRVVGTARS